MNQIIYPVKHRMTWFQLTFWLIVFVGLSLILSSYPIMRLRFDIWDHIDRIRFTVENSDNIAPYAKRAWYLTWASIFRWIGISDIFTYATVVHRTQFVLTSFMIYFSAKQLYSALLNNSTSYKNKKEWVAAMSLCSVPIWFTMTGTFSFIQQAWIMWYSVNYQITLPLLLLSLATIVNIIIVPQTRKLFILKLAGIAISVPIIFFYHAGELVYLLFYLPIILICFGTLYKFTFKQIITALAALCTILYLFISLYRDQTPLLLTHLFQGNYLELFSAIKEKGTWNAVHGGNRYSANWSELYRLSVYIFGIIGLFWIMQQAKFNFRILYFCNLININNRVISFLLLSLVFCFIPTYIYSAGLASVISYDGIVNRYYFASFAFLSFPLAVYILFSNACKVVLPVFAFIFTFFLIILLTLYSYAINKQGVYFNNVKSIFMSISADEIDLGIAKHDIEDIGNQLRAIELANNSNKFIYCGPYESLHIAYYVYGKRNLNFSRMGNHTYKDCEIFAQSIGLKVIYLN